MVRIYVEPTQQVKPTYQVKKKNTLTELDFNKPFAEMTSEELKEKYEEISITGVYYVPKKLIKPKRRRPRMILLDDLLKFKINNHRFNTLFFGDYAINGDETYEEIVNYALYAFAHKDNPNHRDAYFNDVFATIHVVAEGSPAEEAGLRENDHLVQFNGIHIGNYTNIFQLRKIVKRAMDSQQIHVHVRRGNDRVKLIVSPRMWEKPGLIGCQIMSRWGRASCPRWPVLE